MKAKEASRFRSAATRLLTTTKRHGGIVSSALVPYARIGLSILALALLPLWWSLVRTDTQLWLTIVYVSLCAASYGLFKAARSYYWVGRQADKFPENNYDSAYISAMNHLVTHVALFLVQLDWFRFSLSIGRAPRGPATNDGSNSALDFIVTMFVFELILTGLNFYLIFRRTKLVRSVQRNGGD